MENTQTKTNFKHELRGLINKYSLENGSDTPDYILADHLIDCLKNFNETIRMRSSFNGELKEDVQTIDNE